MGCGVMEEVKLNDFEAIAVVESEEWVSVPLP